MSVRGTISVDVAFIDRTTVGGAQSLKTITLRDAQEYTSTADKVAYYHGTVGTAQLSLGNLGLTTYRNAAGNLVTLNAINRIVFAFDAQVGPPFTNNGATADRRLLFYEESVQQGQETLILRSYNGIPAMSAVNNFIGTPVIEAGSRTGVYTIIMYSGL